MTGRIALLLGAWIGIGCAAAACSRDDAPAKASPPPPVETEQDGGASEQPANTVPSSPLDASAGSDASASVPAPDPYDPDIIPEIALSFDAAAMAILSSTDEANRETWVHGSFKMGAIMFADVGVRRKGAITYRALPQKASLKIKLNKWVKGQKIYGLTDLSLHNMVGNASFIVERLAYHVFRSVGLPAPKANTAHLTINGEDYGIYANVETPGEKFLTRVFGTKAKTLYEVNYGSGWMPGSASGFEIDVADPLAPPGARPDVDQLFAAVQAASDADLLTPLAAHLHTTQWLRYSATEAVTGQHDGYAFGLYGSHNYFMAGDTDGKFSLVPWSLDSTLSDRYGVVDAANPVGQTVLTRCKSSPACWAAYKAEVQSVLGVFETLDLVNLAKKWHNQIDPLVKTDPKREHSLNAYNERTQMIYDWLPLRAGVVRAQMGL